MTRFEASFRDFDDRHPIIGACIVIVFVYLVGFSVLFGFLTIWQPPTFPTHHCASTIATATRNQTA